MDTLLQTLDNRSIDIPVPAATEKNLPVILCVDDTSVNLKLLQGVLGQEFRLLLAEDGQQALDLLEQKTPDLVVLDLMMPVLDGYELLRWIRSQERFTTLPVLVITALEERSARLKSFQQGATDFIGKPFDRFELLARCRNLVQLQRATRQLLQLGKLSLDRSERALQEQQQLHRSVLDTIEDLICYKNSAGVYWGCNPAFARLVGRTPEEVCGLTLADLFAPAFAASATAVDRQVLETGKTCTIEQQTAYPDGRQVLLETKVSPMRDQDGIITGLITISRNITGRKELEDSLKALNEQLEQRIVEEVAKNREKDSFMMQQEKLASIGQLAAGVAHEINNPMGYIMSNLNTLKEYTVSLQEYCRLTDSMAENLLPDGQLAVLQQARRRLDLDYIMSDLPSLLDESVEGADRVRRIVLDLKGFARTDDDNPQLTDFNQLIHSTLNLVRSELKYVADLTLELNPLPRILCRSHQIAQVISNLLINAAQAMDQQGAITISSWQEQDQALVRVTDTGTGVPPELHNRIFEPFFTTKPVGKGTGLGLTICHDIIKKHGGTLQVQSTPGVGSSFTVALPIAAVFSAEL